MFRKQSVFLYSFKCVLIAPLTGFSLGIIIYVIFARFLLTSLIIPCSSYHLLFQRHMQSNQLMFFIKGSFFSILICHLFIIPPNTKLKSGVDNYSSYLHPKCFLFVFFSNYDISSYFFLYFIYFLFKEEYLKESIR